MRFLNFRFIVGIAVIIIGILLLLETMGYKVDTAQLRDFWPLIPLLLGLNWIIISLKAAAAPKTEKIDRPHFSWGRLATGVIIFLGGLLYLGYNFELLTQEHINIFWRILLPLLLIIIGLNLLRGKLAGPNTSRLAFMGGIEQGKSPWKLENSSYLALMGGIDLDLTTAEISPGETVIDLTAIMGGIDVKIPPDLPVIFEGSSILGGVSFLNQEDGGIIAGQKVEHNTGEHSRLLRIQALSIMGGVDIREA